MYEPLFDSDNFLNKFTEAFEAFFFGKISYWDGGDCSGEAIKSGCKERKSKLDILWIGEGEENAYGSFCFGGVRCKAMPLVPFKEVLL